LESTCRALHLCTLSTASLSLSMRSLTPQSFPQLLIRRTQRNAFGRRDVRRQQRSFAPRNQRLGCRPGLLKSRVRTQPAQHPRPEKSGIPDQGASFPKPHARFPAIPPARICRRSLPLLALLQSALPNRRYRCKARRKVPTCYR
jgi:hypothetical protein